MAATPAERRALLFLASVACLGVGVRATAAVRREPPRADQRAALARQLDAVDSARAAGRVKKRGATRDGRGVAKTGTATVERRGRGARVGFSQSPLPARHPPPAVAPGVIDVDVASASELEALPRVGPALAARIVADRDSLGPFGSLEALGQVPGIGPALLGVLQSRVTFSGTPRLPHDARDRHPAGRATPSAASPSPPERRPRHPRRR